MSSDGLKHHDLRGSRLSLGCLDGWRVHYTSGEVITVGDLVRPDMQGVVRSWLDYPLVFNETQALIVIDVRDIGCIRVLDPMTRLIYQIRPDMLELLSSIDLATG